MKTLKGMTMAAKVVDDTEIVLEMMQDDYQLFCVSGGKYLLAKKGDIWHVEPNTIVSLIEDEEIGAYDVSADITKFALQKRFSFLEK